MIDENGNSDEEREQKGSSSMQRKSVADIMRQAEMHIAVGEYTQAIEQLVEARREQPENDHILAIIERVESLRSDARKVTTGLESLRNAASPAAQRYLSVTVGKEFDQGIRSEETQSAPVDDELQARVRRLTIVATNLFHRGSYETAFQSLMKAYLLDPTSPHVIECEKMLLPVWELLRERGALSMPDGLYRTSAQTPLSRRVGRSVEPMNAPQAVLPQTGPEPSGDDSPQSARLASLKMQKELERKERERAMWREASKPLNSAGTQAKPPQKKDGTLHYGALQKERGGFFSKLRQGKFLG